MSDGDQIEITTKYIKKVKTVKSGKSYIDNQNNREIKAEIINDRQKLAEDGIVNIAMQINRESKKVIANPTIADKITIIPITNGVILIIFYPVRIY